MGNEEEEFSCVWRSENLNSTKEKQAELRHTLMSSIGATANKPNPLENPFSFQSALSATNQPSHLDGRFPNAMAKNLDPVLQTVILGPGVRSRTASNIQIESNKLVQQYNLDG